jgi:hypothetical protein
MATLKEFEAALREYGMTAALGLLEKLREQERAKRHIARPRRATGTRMTPELAQKIRELHRTTMFTQQEIAFKLGVNQGRVNEVIKHGKWLSAESSSLERAAPLPSSRKRRLRARPEGREQSREPRRASHDRTQLSLGDF